MDIALGLKIINMVYKMITSRYSEIPDNFSNSKPEFIPAKRHEDLKLYRQHCLNDRVIDDFIYQLKHDNRVNLAGLGIMYKGKMIREEYVYPYSSYYRHVSFSVSKSIVSMAVGIAISKNIISLDDRLVDFFPEYNNLFVKRDMRVVKIKHLLTMTAGALFDEISAFFSEDWSMSYIEGDVMYEPGSDFSYNSLNTYMLVSAICRKAKTSLKEFLETNLFNPLNIYDITWDLSPEETEQGGWGVKLSIPDMLKLGQLYLNKGKWIVDGKETSIIDADWIEESIKIHVDLSDKEVILGYGYHIWLLKDGAYLFNGLFGQNIYINPEKEIVIAITASAYEVFPGGGLVSKICNFVEDDGLYDNSFITNIRNLFKKSGYELIKREKIRYDEETFFYVLSEYFDNKYIFDEYAASILPIAIQGFYSMFSTGIKSLVLKKIDNQLWMIVEENNIEYSIHLGFLNEKYEYQVITIKGKEIPVAAYCDFAFDEDDRFLLKIKLIYLEEVGSRVFKIFFNDNFVTLKATENPDLKEFTGILFGESKIRRTKNLKKIKTPDYLDYKINKILSPISKGDIIS